MGKEEIYGKGAGTGEWNGQRAILVCGQPEDGKEERGPPEQQRTLYTCSNQGREWGDPPPRSAPPACGQGMEGDTPTRQRAPSARSQGMEEGGRLPTHERALPARIQGIEGDTPTRQCAPPVRSQETEERGGTP